MRISTKIILALSAMVLLILAGSLYTYLATSRLTAVLSRLLDQELPEIDKLDRLQVLITLSSSLETQILSDPEEHPEYLERFTRVSEDAQEIVDALQPLDYIDSSPQLVSQLQTQLKSLIETQREAVSEEKKNDFLARQFSTDAVGIRLDVLANVSRLEGMYKRYLEEHERANLTLGRELQQLSIAFAALSVLVAALLVIGGIRSILVPLRHLVRVTETIAGGQLQEEANENRRDEFGRLARSFNMMVRALRGRIDEVADKNRILEEAERTLQRQLRLAQHVQRSIVPRGSKLEGLDTYGRIHAAQRIGGDFYDVQSAPDGHRIGLVIGDASGSGIPAALVMVLALTVLREAGRQTDDPAEILDRVNKGIREQFPDEMLDAFITAAYVMVDLEHAKIRYANGGHEPPMLWRAATREVVTLHTRGFFLAAWDDATFEAGEQSIAPGDKVLLCTDGLVETRDPDGKFFGRERLEAWLSEHGDKSCQELGEQLLEEATRFRGSPVPKDDVAILIAEVKPGGGTPQ